MTLVVLVVVCLLPALAFVLFSRGFDWLVRFEGFGRRDGRGWQRRRPPAGPAAETLAAQTLAAQTLVAETLAALAADLRRLDREHAWLLRADVPGKAARLRAVQLAYDDTLLRAARLLEVDEAALPAPPLVAATRLQAEAELATRGFTW